MMGSSFRFSFTIDPSRLVDDAIIELAKFGFRQIWKRRESFKTSIKNNRKLYFGFHLSIGIILIMIAYPFMKIRLGFLVKPIGIVGLICFFKAFSWLADYDESFRNQLQEALSKLRSIK